MTFACIGRPVVKAQNLNAEFKHIPLNGFSGILVCCLGDHPRMYGSEKNSVAISLTTNHRLTGSPINTGDFYHATQCIICNFQRCSNFSSIAATKSQVVYICVILKL